MTDPLKQIAIGRRRGLGPAWTLGPLLAGLLAAGVFGFAAAQPAPPSGAPPWAALPPQGESTVVEELDIHKRLPGPALWRVTKAGSEVVILGGLTPIPHLLAWDTSRVEHALDDATVLLMPPRPRIGFADMVGFAWNRGMLELPRGQTLQSVLPPATRDRFLRLTTQIHKTPADYARWKPAVAGFLLLGDFRRAAGLSDGKPGTTVVKLAQARRVPIRYVGDFNVMPYARAMANFSPAESLACFDAALDDIDREAGYARAAAQAWANADLKAVGRNYSISILDRCLLQAPNVQALVDRGTGQGVQEINQALNKPGRAVAVIDLDFLLRANGVLDRLKAEGATISVPTQ